MSGKLKNATLEEIKNFIEEELNKNSEPISDVKAIYEFHITGEEEDTFQLQLQGGQAKIVQGDKEVADCVLTMSFKSFQQFLIGKLSGTVAFMTGKLKLKGDISKALKLESILKQYKIQ
ncbi:SCP2 sterol-binding domain-containing protein [Caldibacillus thermolactis]|jgi:putative sterol carrier protein|uniref:SCP2 sterol-binding domain-containing protein n=1 Tax=Pallidibacillus thermolactis TaxID=251051 RepID=A0ABT2WCJ0_9BACI|nr:SCP2 sterol-binding domain-containing protein [Pallidibacillus thermolactis]MCU9593383.1 SCP2 sterol-binding domain-containing protein [Pallidibacillus thermolactis]MCU9602732.1 SCP2 sterol-binding domain-containing protein [Pallidibacillus thermolactis subsp. kokeshiiformis]MED1673750.1 SCP2 sterol-binding domain-containing protein [Pallidibacillus thermolactis subsp. kokeshiiformis]